MKKGLMILSMGLFFGTISLASTSDIDYTSSIETVECKDDCKKDCCKDKKKTEEKSEAKSCSKKEGKKGCCSSKKAEKK